MVFALFVASPVYHVLRWLTLSSIDAATPTWAPMHRQLGFSYESLNNSYAIGCAALAIGAPLLIPFALKFGRRPVYVFSTAIQFALTVWSARLQTVADLMLVNLFSCLVGSLAEVIVQMTVADMFFVYQRGTMNSLYYWSTRIGAQLAPLAAGYVTLSQGWRWVWWWIAIFFGVNLVAFLFAYEETRFVAPRIDGIAMGQGISLDEGPVKEAKNDKARSLRSVKDVETQTIAGSPVTAVTTDPGIPLKTYRQRLALWSSSPGSLGSFFRHSYQAFMVLFTIPGVFYMSLVYGAVFVATTVMVTTLSSYMAQAPWNFNSAQIGLMSLAPFTGTTIGTLLCGPLSDWLIVFLSKRNNGIYEPEMRLWVMAAFIPFVPAGIFLFGAGLEHGLSWPVLAIGYGLTNLGTGPASSIALSYIADAYTEVIPAPFN